MQTVDALEQLQETLEQYRQFLAYMLRFSKTEKRSVADLTSFAIESERRFTFVRQAEENLQAKGYTEPGNSLKKLSQEQKTLLVQLQAEKTELITKIVEQQRLLESRLKVDLVLTKNELHRLQSVQKVCKTYYDNRQREPRFIDKIK